MRLAHSVLSRDKRGVEMRPLFGEYEGRQVGCNRDGACDNLFVLGML